MAPTYDEKYDMLLKERGDGAGFDFWAHVVQGTSADGTHPVLAKQRCCGAAFVWAHASDFRDLASGGRGPRAVRGGRKVGCWVLASGIRGRGRGLIELAEPVGPAAAPRKPGTLHKDSIELQQSCEATMDAEMAQGNIAPTPVAVGCSMEPAPSVAGSALDSVSVVAERPFWQKRCAKWPGPLVRRWEGQSLVAGWLHPDLLSPR